MNKFLDQLLAVVVLYNQDIKDSKTLISLHKAIPNYSILDLLLYDNSPFSQRTDENTFTKFNFIYFHNSSNPGVSTAYNYGARKAEELNKKWLLILDQDTSLDANILQEFQNSTEEYDHIELFAPILRLSNGKILSPCSFKNYHGSHLEKVDFGVQEFNQNSLVNSGILVSLRAFNMVGGYNEKVKLDLSDHQFIERFKRQFRHFAVIRSIGLQSFSVMDDSFEKQVIRFKFYCEGVHHFESNHKLGRFFLIYFLLLKTFKRSIKFRSKEFISVFYGVFFDKKSKG